MNQENERVEYVSTHLYDSVPLHPPEHFSPSIESVILNKKRKFQLPKERASTSQCKSKKIISAETNSIFTNLKTSYDISHRQPHKSVIEKIEDPPECLEPNLVSIHPPRGKYWVAKQRKNAQILKDELVQLQKKATEDSKKCKSEFLARVFLLERGIEAHQYVLNKFTEQEKEFSNERYDILTKICGHYKDLGSEIPNITEEFDKNMEIAEKDLAQAQSEKDEAQKERDLSIAAIDRQNKTIESLKQQLSECKQRCTLAEAQLREIRNEKSAIQRSSRTNRVKLQEIIEQLEQKQEQKKKLNNLVDALTKDINGKMEELRLASNELKELESELHLIDKQYKGFECIVADREKLKQRLINTPLANNEKVSLKTAETQVNTIPKRLDPKKKAIDNIKSSISGAEEFKQIKSDLQLLQKELPDLNHPNEPGGFSLEINNYDDLAKVRELILKNNHKFDYSVTSLVRAHSGVSELQYVDSNEAREFSRWTIKRIMENATYVSMRSDHEVQTDVAEDDVKDMLDVVDGVSFDGDQMFRKAPRALAPFLRQSRFISLLESDESNREPRDLAWLIHSIRSIFDEKTVDDRTQKRYGEPTIPMPEYVLKWAFRQYGRSDLVQKGCWDLFITSHHHMQKYLEITLFVKFLDEKWGVEQLTFFLMCRTWILTRCVTIPVQHIDIEEYLNETYMTKSQVHDFFTTFFPDLESEIKKDITIRGFSCSDPTRGNENESACIPMNRILELAVGEVIDEQIRRLRKLLALYGPYPRMSLEKFSSFVDSMIPNIDHIIVDSLYRSSLVPNSIRVDMNHEDFIEYFKSSRKVLPKDFNGDDITCEQFANYSQTYAMVLTRYKQFEGFLSRMLEALAPNATEATRILVNEIRHEAFQLLESKLSFDGVLFYQSFHRVLQVVMTSCLRLALPEPVTYQKQIEELLTLIQQKHITFTGDTTALDGGDTQNHDEQAIDDNMSGYEAQ